MIDQNELVNIALEALRLSHVTTDAQNDTNPSVKKIMRKYRIGLVKALADMDLNKTSTKVKLEELTLEHPHWNFVYKYPSKCAKFRKIVSPFPIDNKMTMIPSATEVVNKVDCILTNQEKAYADIISEDVNLSCLSASGAMAAGNMIALMCTSLIVGKDSRKIKQDILSDYAMYKAQAQAEDLNENVDYTPDTFKSEFVAARLGGSCLRKNW